METLCCILSICHLCCCFWSITPALKGYVGSHGTKAVLQAFPFVIATKSIIRVWGWTCLCACHPRILQQYDPGTQISLNEIGAISALVSFFFAIICGLRLCTSNTYQVSHQGYTPRKKSRQPSFFFESQTGGTLKSSKKTEKTDKFQFCSISDKKIPTYCFQFR